MSEPDWLWDEVHELFDTDDGSLPEIHVDYTNSQSFVSGFAFLRGLPANASPGPPSFWSCSHQQERLVDSVPDVAALVVSGEAQPFHMIFSGIRMRDVTIPDLGVFVFPHQLALDYRMGIDWDGAKVEALFKLLLDLLSFDPEAKLSLECMPPGVEEARFHAAWSRFIRESTARDVC